MATVVTCGGGGGGGVVARRVPVQQQIRKKKPSWQHAVCYGQQCGEQARNWWFSKLWYLEFMQSKVVVDCLNQLGAKFAQLRLDFCLLHCVQVAADATDTFCAKWHWILSDEDVQLAGTSQLDFGVIHRRAASDQRWRANSHQVAIPLVDRAARLLRWMREINQLHQQLLLSWVHNVEVTLTTLLKQQEASILSDLLSYVDTLPSTLAVLITEYARGELYMSDEFSLA